MVMRQDDIVAEGGALQKMAYQAWFGVLEFILKDLGRELEAARLILSLAHMF